MTEDESKFCNAEYAKFYRKFIVDFKSKFGSHVNHLDVTALNSIAIDFMLKRNGVKNFLPDLCRYLTEFNDNQPSPSDDSQPEPGQ